MKTYSINNIYFSSVVEKRHNARQLFTQLGEELVALTEVKQHRHRLEELALKLQHSMQDLVMFALCAKCGAEDDGGCCSSFMAGETDAIQLLMNMILGGKVEVQRDDGVECCYLGKRGCIFALKPFFCLNYNCGQIMAGNSKAALAPYLAASAALLQEQNLLEIFLVDFLRNKELLEK